MVEQTKRGEKFTQAREYVKAHPRLAKTLMNWQKMHGPTLYKALQLSGVQWDMVKKAWYGPDADSTVDNHRVIVSKPSHAADRTTVQVRIIADPSVVAQVVSDMCEIARALNWLLVRNSGVRKGHYGEKRIVYLKFDTTTRF